MPKPNTKKTDTAATSTAVAKPRGWARPTAEINAIIRKAEKGDAPALEEVRGMFARAGTADMLGGNIAREALRLLVKKATGENPVIKEATERKFDELRAELLGPSPTALERLLVERVVATWYHLHYVEALYGGRESTSLALGLYYQKSITAAQKRYLDAIKGLAEVRKLALPALQVNIANKQVNVAAGSVTAELPPS